LEPLPRFAKAIGAESVWMKRDDLTGLAMGGNKLRKLEYLIGEAMEQKADLIITGGSPQSNHARLTVAAANKAGMETWLCFAGNRAGSAQGNYFLDHLLGASVFLTGAYGSEGLLVEMEKKAEEARKSGRNPYVIPVGGSTATGDYGYCLAWAELENQRRALGLPPFEEIVLAAGTGGTMAGLLAGMAIRPTSTRLIGISVWEKRERILGDVRQFADQLLEKLGETNRLPSSFDIFDDYIGRKYGVPSPEGNQAIRLLAETEGILLDPIYTGKAMAGLVDLVSRGACRAKHLLFWHTGGTPALFTHAPSFLGGESP